LQSGAGRESKPQNTLCRPEASSSQISISQLNGFADRQCWRWNRAACLGKANVDSKRSRRCLMLSTDIVAASCRNNRGNLLATNTTDIPEREQSRVTKRRRPTRQPQAAKVAPAEFRSGTAETIGHFSIEYDFGACFSSCARLASPEGASGRKTQAGVRIFPNTQIL
jgi:hypothetical protein